jgi:hypothetical protein
MRAVELPPYSLEVQQPAGHLPDKRGRVTAFTFDSLTGIPRPVPYSALSELKCVGPATYVSPEAISHDQLVRIISAGSEDTIS